MFERLQPKHLIRGHAMAFAAVAAWVALSLQPACAQVAPANDALPTGANVVAGSANVVTGGTAAAPVMTVNQGSDRAIVNWNTFNVGRDSSVVFQQPNASSVILNRVLDMSPSQIFGNLQANGQVFLLNPAGVWFGPSSSVDVGALVATTHSMSNADFMAGNYRFERNGATGSVVNEGSIEAKLGGYIALLAPEVRNEGVLLAKSGTIALAAGETVTMNVNPANSQVDLLVSPSTVDALIENKKIVKAPEGRVIVSAQAYNELASGVIKNSGEISAAGITKVGGKIILGASAELANSGSIDASSAMADGGSVSIDANVVKNSGLINVAGAANSATAANSASATLASASAKGGEVSIAGNYIYIEGSAKIDATGITGGGQVLVGGDWQGGGDLRHAIKVAMDANASIDASAIVNGNGGTIVLWSDTKNAQSFTLVNGSLAARGGIEGGDGGKIETSGHTLLVDAAQVDASSAKGTSGEWLLDPYDIEINSTDNNLQFSGIDITSNNVNSQVNVTRINNSLNSGTSVAIKTGDGGSATGALKVNAAISKTGGGDATLTLQAADNIVISQPISSSSNKLHLNLFADTDVSGNHNGAGVVIINSNLTTNGGNLKFGNGDTINFGGVTTMVGGDVYVQGSSALTFSTNNGTVTVNGEMLIGNPSGLTINSGNGNVTFNGSLNSGNSYTRVTSELTWESAVSAAKSGNGDAAGNSYLATITSRLENAIASQAAGYQSAWLGGRRVVGYGTDNLWRWVTGPEAFMDGGKGLAFSSQNASGGGASSYNGYFNNWASGEPNNWNGSSAGALSSELESATQFTGSLGQWNDLPRNSPTLTYYVKETNAAPSPLTVTAGTGAVTFNSAVGTSKELSTLSVTSGTMTASSIKVSSGLSVTNSGAATISSINSGSTGGLTKAGAGTLTLTGISTYSGATTVNGGTLKIDSGAAIYCDSTCGSGAQFGAPATAITTVNSTGVLDLTSATWAGSLGERFYEANALVINGGTLRYSGPSGSASELMRGVTIGANGATFDSATSGVAWTFIDGTSQSSTYKSVFNGNVNFTGAGDFVFGHPISSSGSLTMNGSGKLSLTAANTYSGTTTISSGTLQVGSGSTTGSLGTGNVVNNGSLIFNRSDTYIVPNLISGTGSVTKLAAGTTALTNANTYGGGTTLSAGTLGVYDNAALGTGTVTVSSGANNAALLFGRSVASFGNALVLNANASFDLDTSVDYLLVGGGGGGGAHVGGGGGGGGVLAGTVDLGSSSLNVTVGAGGTGTVNSYGSFTAGSNGDSSSLSNSSVNLVALGGGVGASWTTYTANAGSTNVASGGGGAYNGPGAGTSGQGYSGGTGYNSSPYAAGGGGGAGGAGGNGVVPTPDSNVNAVGGAGGTGLASSITGTSKYYGGGGGGGVHGSSNYFYGALGGAGGLGGGGQGSPLTTTVTGQSGTTVYGNSGTANTGGGGGGSGGHLSQTVSRGGNGGSGIAIVRYLGGTAGTGGTPQPGSGSATGYTLHTFTTTGSSTLSLNPVAVTLTGAISGSGGVTANATGGTMKFNGTNSYTGATSITGGVVQANNLSALGNNSVLTLSNIAGVQMQLLNSLNIGSLAGGGTTGGNVLLNTGTVLNTGANNTSTSYAGVMSGAGGLTKSGTGTFTLTGNNIYSGDTTISGGSLQIGNAGTTGTLGSGNVVDNASLVFNRSDSLVVPNTISGTGSLTKQGASALSLTASNSYGGGTTLSAGTLGLYNNTAAGSGAVTASGSTSVLLGRAVSTVANNFTLNGAVTFDLDDNLDYLIVGGGGGGGTRHAGGGGGGGVLTGSTSFAGGSYSIAVGAGGSGAGACNNGSYTQCTVPTGGGNSSIAGTDFTTMTAFGGGAGYSLNINASALNGGSGGGGQGVNPGGTGTVGQGYNGGAGSSGGGNSNWTGGGGGGAGAVGGNGSSTGVAGSGGIGLASSITGSSQYYGGGGGGSSYVGYTAGAGGLGGGGAGGGGAGGLAGVGTAGTANTGGGGGAGAFDSAGWNFSGGAGGSGVVIVRYIGSSAGSGGTPTAGTGTATGYTLHTFTSTGSSALALNPIALQLSGTISGTGSMTANATGGTMKFTGANSYTGATSITGGIVQTNNLSALGNNSALTLSNVAGAQLQLLNNLNIGSLAGGGTSGGNVLLGSAMVLNAGANNTSTSYAGVLSGAGGLTKSGSGTLTLTGTNSFTGDTTISAGTLQIGNAGTTGTLGTGNVADNGSLIFNRSDSLVVPNVISGTGNLIKLGSGALSLTGANSYSGVTSLSAGTLGLYTNSAAGSGTVTASAGTSVLFGRLVSSVANNFTLNGTVNFDLDDSIEYLIVGGGGGGGTGTASEHGGGGGGGGGVLTNTASGFGSGTYTVTVGAGGTGGSLAPGGTGGSSSLGSITALGGGGGSTYLYGAGTSGGSGGGGAVSTTAANRLGAAGTAGQGNAGGTADSNTIGRGAGGGGGAGSVGGNFTTAGSVTNGGSGGLGLLSSINGTAQYYGGGGGGGGNVGGTGSGARGGGGDGGSFSASGTSTAGAAGAANTGGGGGGGIGNTGSSFKPGGAGGSGIVIARYLGGTAGSGGTPVAGTGSARGYTVHTFTTTGNNTLTLNPIAVALTGNISGSGGVSADATGGTITFSGNNAYTGATAITGGLVRANNLGALGSNSALTMSNVAGAQLQLLNNLSIGSLAGGGATGGNIALGSYTLTAGGNNSSTSYGGVMSGTGAFTKSGSGTQTLTAAQTYTGDTTISGGTLQLGTGSSVVSLASTNIVNNGNLVLNYSGDATVANNISGTGNLQVTGGKTGLLSAYLTTTPQLLASNATVAEVLYRLSGGRMNGVEVTAGVGPREAGVYAKNFDPLTNTATFQTQFYDTVYTKAVFVKLTQSGTNVMAAIDASGAYANGAGYTAANILGTNMSSGYSYNMPLATADGASGYGVDRLYGSSKITLTGNNSYTGTTTINNTTTTVSTGGTQYSATAYGTLQLNAGVPSSGSIANSGVLIFNGSSAQSSGLVVSGSGVLIKNGTNTLTLTGPQTYTGPTIVNAGTLQFGTGGTTGLMASSSSLWLPFASAKLTINRSDNLTLSNAVRGVGTLVKLTSSDLTLTANNLNAVFDIDDGNLIVQNDAPTIAGSSFYGPGNLIVQSANNSFSSAYTLSGVTFNSDLGGLTIGRAANNADVTLSSAATIAGPVNIYGGNLTVGANINTVTSATGNVLLKATGNINLNSGRSITTGGSGTVTLWGDSDANGSGYVQLLTNAAITTANGAITLGGGSNILTGYARGEATRDTESEASATLHIAGVHMRSGVTLTSSTGDITLRGQNAGGSPAALSWGVFGNGTIIDSGTGKISISGLATGSANLNAQAISNYGTLTLRSANTTTRAISLVGDASGVTAGSAAMGMNVNGLIEATGAGGGIYVYGKAGTGSDDYGTVMYGSALARSGPITLIGENSASQIGLYIGSLTIGARSATNVTSSSSAITLQGQQFTFAGTNPINTSGTLSLLPLDGANSFGAAQTVSNLTLSSGITGLTVGGVNNTSGITLGQAVTISGPVSVYGGDIALNGNINTTAGSATGDVLLKSTDNITLGLGKSITTTGGDVIFWANSDGGTSNGGVFFDQGSSVTTGTGSTGGGHIWIGGSSTANGSTTWNGLTVGNGAATSGKSVSSFAKRGSGVIDWQAGVLLDETTLSSGGGNIFIYGKRNTGTTYGAGFINYSGNGTTINAGGGTIEIKGESVDTAYLEWGVMTGLHPADYSGKFTLRSSNTTAPSAISLWGSTAGGEDGILIENATRILSTAGTNGGGISITGFSGTRNALSVGIGANSGTLEALSASGPITVDVGAKPLLVASQGIFRLGSVAADADVASSTANVSFISNNPSWSGQVPVRTTGMLSVAPAANSSFTSTFNSSSLNYTGITGLTIGNDSNTTAVTIGSATTVAGPVTVLAGDINVNANINTSSGNANGDILLKSSGTITQAAGVTVTANGGDVIYWANTDGQATAGSVFLREGTAISTGGGHLWMGGGSGSTTWNGLTVGNGYAVAGATLTGQSCSNCTMTSGISLEAASLQTAGGSISLRGRANMVGSGMSTVGNTLIDAGAGKLSIEATSTGWLGLVPSIHYQLRTGGSRLTLRSTNASADAIVVEGSSTSSEGIYGGSMLVEATNGGGIKLTGSSAVSGTAGINFGFSTNSASYDILANSGPITINGGSSLTVASGTTLTIGQKAGSSVTASSSDISLIADSMSLRGSVASSGNLTLRPSTASGTIGLGSATGTLSLSASLFSGASRILSDGFSGITIGAANGGAIAVGGAVAFTDSATLLSSGNITLNSGASVSSSQASGTLAIAAGGNFVNNAGSSAVSTTDPGANDRWIVYSSNSANATFGPAANNVLVSGNDAIWSNGFSTLAPSSVASGNRYVFANAPSVSVTTTSLSKTYGDTPSTRTSSVSARLRPAMARSALRWPTSSARCRPSHRAVLPRRQRSRVARTQSPPAAASPKQA